MKKYSLEAHAVEGSKGGQRQIKCSTSRKSVLLKVCLFTQHFVKLSLGVRKSTLPLTQFSTVSAIDL